MDTPKLAAPSVRDERLSSASASAALPNSPDVDCNPSPREHLQAHSARENRIVD